MCLLAAGRASQADVCGPAMREREGERETERETEREREKEKERETEKIKQHTETERN